MSESSEKPTGSIPAWAIPLILGLAGGTGISIGGFSIGANTGEKGMAIPSPLTTQLKTCEELEQEAE